MPDIRGKGLPFILTKPWQLPRLVQGSVPIERNYPTGPLILLARRRRESINSHSIFYGPMVVAPGGLRPVPRTVKMVPPPAVRHRTRSVIRQPAVIQAAAFTPQRATTRFAGRPQFRARYESFVRGPTIVGPAVYVPPPYRTVKAQPPIQVRRPLRQQSKIRPPVIIAAPAPVFNARPTIRLTKFDTGRYRVGFRQFFEPTTINLPSTGASAPAQIQLTRWPSNRYRLGYGLIYQPTIINPFVAPAPPTLEQSTIHVTLAPSFNPAFKTHYRMLPPTIIGEFVPPVGITQFPQDRTFFMVYE